ncbi:hypothetical protein PoB_007559000 [Plakobranchus ocellatus]|uniref:Uncharacterized protein n=1 Tax=Plakobranchus ocellatus TaxID=259542 RepID=A0AAV4DYJ1_9GAST|nr:hypothetical protein PoB_007559000 [Plakobranchus ocellatus]
MGEYRTPGREICCSVAPSPPPPLAASALRRDMHGPTGPPADPLPLSLFVVIRTVCGLAETGTYVLHVLPYPSMDGDVSLAGLGCSSST